MKLLGLLAKKNKPACLGLSYLRCQQHLRQGRPSKLGLSTTAGMASQSSSSSVPPSSHNDPIDPSNYDLDRLIPDGVTDFYAVSPSSRAKIAAAPTAEARNWLRISAFTTASVGMFAKFWLKGIFV